jgi:hypothetical protein
VWPLHSGALQPLGSARQKEPVRYSRGTHIVLTGYAKGTRGVRTHTRLQTLDSARQKEPVRYWSEEEHNKFLDGIDKFGARSAACLWLLNELCIGRVPLSVNRGPPVVIMSTRYCQ